MRILRYDPAPGAVRGQGLYTFDGSDAMTQKITCGLLAAAFVAAIGFGAAQAVAAPAAATQAAACQQDVCTRKCADQGLIGICSGRGCYCR